MLCSFEVTTRLFILVGRYCVVRSDVNLEHSSGLRYVGCLLVESGDKTVQ